MWSDYSDYVISNVDKKIGNKYKPSLRELLTTPASYANTQNIKITMQNMKEAVNNFIDGIISSMGDQSKELEDALTVIESATSQLKQNISLQAKQNKVPMVKPVIVDRDASREDKVFVSNVNADILQLVQKFISESTFIADLSYNYKNVQIGSWLFCGPKNYSLNIYLPQNDVVSLEAARSEVLGLLDAASTLM